jgi:hypothetical protein
LFDYSEIDLNALRKVQGGSEKPEEEENELQEVKSIHMQSLGQASAFADLCESAIEHQKVVLPLKNSLKSVEVMLRP